MLISADADGQGRFPEAVLQPESLFLLADIIVFQAQTQIFAAVVADVNVRIFPLIFAEPDLEKSSARMLSGGGSRERSVPSGGQLPYG